MRTLCLMLLAGCAAEPLRSPYAELGKPLSPSALARIDTDLAPVGPVAPGRGTVAEGRAIFAERCASCHGADAAGVPYDALAPRAPAQRSTPSQDRPGTGNDNPQRTIGRYWPYATTLYDYIQRAMPQLAPGSLSHQETYALTAFLLYRNGILDADAAVDGAMLQALEMPARTRFFFSSEAPEP